MNRALGSALALSSAVACVLGCMTRPPDPCTWPAPQAPSGACASFPGAPTAAGSAEDRVALTGGAQLVRNVTYAHRGGLALQGDLYLPSSSADAGVLVVIHGGGWQDCARRRAAVDADAYVWSSALGVPTFNIEYRLVEEGGGYPENLLDVKCAVQWVQQAAPSLGYRWDPSRVAVIGESAGAHLALMTALTQDRSDLLDPACGTAPTVAAAASYSAPTDLAALGMTGLSSTVNNYAGPCSGRVTGCSTGRACARCEDGSPLAHVCGARGRYFLVHANDNWDALVPQEESERLAVALADAGVAVQLDEPSGAALADAGCAQGQAHGFVPCLTSTTGADVTAFLRAAIGP